MKEFIVWVIHTPAGSIALVSALVALCSRKGTATHRIAGVYFTVSMLIMLVSGGMAALLKKSLDDAFLSGMVIYTVFTAWLTVYHKKGQTNILEYSALTWIALIAIAAYLADPSWGHIRNPNTYPLWIGFALLFAIGDIHNLIRSSLSGPLRILRHVWRMGFSLIWAALAFSDKIIKLQGSTIEEMPYIAAIPAILILLTIFYWVAIISLFSPKKFIKY